MRKQYKNLIKVAKKSLVLVFIFMLMVAFQVWAADNTDFSQSIAAGTQNVLIVDAGGTEVGSPGVTFPEESYNFDNQDATGQLAPSAQRIRVYNPTSDDVWSVTIAASDPADTWTTGSSDYDFNDAGGYADDGATTDADSYGGQMTIDPSTNGTITAVSPCASTTNVSKGTSDSFVQTSNNSIDILSGASGSSTFCRWDYTSSAANITQKIPAAQAAGSYTLTMSLTIT